MAGVLVVELVDKVEEEDKQETLLLEEKKNPLMIEDILDKIFPYFNDKHNLTSFRLVNQAWNSSVLRTIQNKLSWTIDEEMGRTEERFLSHMNECKNIDIFKKFFITPRFLIKMGSCWIHHSFESLNNKQQLIDDDNLIYKFLLKYGSNITDLEFHALSHIYTKSYLNNFHLLPNLKTLKLCHVTDEVFAKAKQLSDKGITNTIINREIVLFPNLHQIGFHGCQQFLMGLTETSTTSIYFNLFKAAPACKVLEIMSLPKTTDYLLASTDTNIVQLFANLSSFSTLLDSTNTNNGGGGERTEPIIFNLIGFENLIGKCSNLQKLSTRLRNTNRGGDEEGFEEEIYGHLAKISHSLMELNLELMKKHVDNCFQIVRVSAAEDFANPFKNRSGDVGVHGEDGDDDFDSIVASGSRTENEEGNEESQYSKSTSEAEEFNAASADLVLASGDATINEIDKPAKPENNSKDGDDSINSEHANTAEVDDEPPHGIKRSIDGDEREDKNEEPPKKIRVRKTMFPYLSKLRKLTLKQFHLYNNYDVFNNMPALVHVDLELKPCNILERPIIEPTYGHNNVKYLRLRSRDDPTGAKLKLLAIAFPNLTELDVDLPNDTSLRIVFGYMCGLKRLHLNTSKISDLGMTGILGIDPAQTHLINWSAKQPGAWRSHPYIGNLVELQHLTYMGTGLTHMSVDHGIIDCKQLTYLKLPPYEERTRECYFAEPDYRYKYVPKGSLRAQIAPILKNCSYLVRLDIRSSTTKNIICNGFRHNSASAIEMAGSNDGATTYTVNKLDLAFVKAQGQAPYFKEILFDTNEEL